MIDPTLMADLVRAGVTDPDLLQRVANVMHHAFVTLQERVDERKKTSERSRRYRARKKPSRDALARVVSSSSKKDTTGKKVKRERGQRIPPDFQPDIPTAVAEGLSRAQAERESKKFVDYWLGVPGEKGVKLDWPATWRNWVRRKAEDLGVQSTGPPTNGGHQIERIGMEDIERIRRENAEKRQAIPGRTQGHDVHPEVDEESLF